MALSKEKISLAIALLKKGGMSNIAISKKVGCSESAIRTIAKKHGVKKNEITSLAKEEVDTIIKQNEIKTRKNELSELEKTIYDEVLITEVQSRNLSLNANHLLLQKIYLAIEDGTKLEKINVGDGVQNFEPVGHGSGDHLNYAKAIQAVTDNLGITSRHAPKIEVNNQNNQQTNVDIVGYGVKTIEN